jgi:alkylation response protein AidB-like acyl-CoA dehydrogenase
MNFDLSEEQQALVNSAAAFVKRDSPVSRARRLRADERGWSQDTWRSFAELGWLGLPFPEAVGGLGGRFVDVALLVEQLGTSLVPEPYLASVLFAGTAIAQVAPAVQAKTYLGPMIDGHTSLALALTEPGGRFEPTTAATRAERRGAAYLLTGQKTWVLNGHVADVIVVSAQTAGGLSLFAVPRDAPGVTLRPVATMDGRRAAFVELSSAQGELLGAEGAAPQAVVAAFDLAAAATCAEGAGVMQAALSMTVDYLGQREQFGVKIGSFQVLQHRAVDMFIETELAKSMMLYAAIKADEGDAAERAWAVSQAKVQLAVSGRFVTQQSIQLHGGIGVTDEHDIGLYFKRMHVLGLSFGDEEYHLARMTSLPQFAAR